MTPVLKSNWLIQVSQSLTTQFNSVSLFCFYTQYLQHANDSHLFNWTCLKSVSPKQPHVHLFTSIMEEVSTKCVPFLAESFQLSKVLIKFLRGHKSKTSGNYALIFPLSSVFIYFRTSNSSLGLALQLRKKDYLVPESTNSVLCKFYTQSNARWLKKGRFYQTFWKLDLFHGSSIFIKPPDGWNNG